MSIKMKAHLKEIHELYEKVKEFDNAVVLKHEYSPEVNGSRCYIDDDIDQVVEVFSKIFNIGGGEMDDIKINMRNGKSDFMSLMTDRSVFPEEQLQILHILSRPFFHALANAKRNGSPDWEKGTCTVCGAVPSLSVMEKESKRQYCCSYCGSAGNYLRIGCPNCLTEDPEDITVLSIEGEDGMRADTCDKCKTYYKSFDVSMTIDHSIDVLDILSVPLDIIVQDKGYKRTSPNPAGMISMD